MSNISVVIPVYRSEACLKTLYTRLKESLEKVSENFEIIMVEDCGGDRSWDIIQELSKADKRVKGIQLNRNCGQHNALLCGIREARYDITITMDDDLQHPPEEISKLIEKLPEGHDVVYGIPKKRQHFFLRNAATHITKSILLYTMNVSPIFNISAFRVFRTYLRETFADYQGSFVSIDILLSWSTKRFTTVPVRHEQRLSGKSNYNFLKLVTYTLNILTGFSSVPLQLASLVGFIFTIFGIGIFIHVIHQYIVIGSVVPGFPFLASIIAIFSGVQLFALGVIGEYLARVYFNVMQKPPYVIRPNSSDSKTG